MSRRGAAATRVPLLVPAADGTGIRRASLPPLSGADEALLARGERIQRQELSDGAGTGYAVQDVNASAGEVFAAVAAFGRYKELIPTVQRADRYESEGGGLCFRYLVSRIRLVLHVRFSVDEVRRRAAWELERSSWVLRSSTGFWQVEQTGPGRCRVWFCVEVTLTARVPGFVLNLVSRLGLAKATRWVQALAEAPA